MPKIKMVLIDDCGLFFSANSARLSAKTKIIMHYALCIVNYFVPLPCQKKTIVMFRKLRILFSVSLLCVAGFCQHASAQVEKVDYLWLVDVSGERNIYLEGIQHAIDTFYVVATKHDALHVYNFAKTVATKEDIVDADFYQYSDLGCMVTALDSLIKHSNSRYVRAFVLSDFFHHSPKADDEHFNPELFADVRNDLEKVCSTKNVQISLMILPPSSLKGEYALDALQSLLPTSYTETFGASPDQRTVDFLMQKVEAVNRLRGVSNEVVEESSPLATYIILGVFLAALAGLGIYLKLRPLSNSPEGKEG